MVPASWVACCVGIVPFMPRQLRRKRRPYATHARANIISPKAALATDVPAEVAMADPTHNIKPLPEIAVVTAELIEQGLDPALLI